MRTSATVAAAAALVRGNCCTMRESESLALSFRPSDRSWRAFLSIESAFRSLGTVRARYAAVAPRIEETMAVRVRRTRTFTLLLPAEAADERDEIGFAAILDLKGRPDARDEGQALRAARSDRDDHPAVARQ